jgi:4-hydroxymandelate oxidase
MTPLEELVNAFEFEAAAKVTLPPATFAEISGGDRRAFERITFRPRMMVNTTRLDLSSQLFGSELFAPIIVGPVAGLKRFCPEGELAMVRGASSAKAPVVISTRASYSLAEIAAQARTPLWCQVSPDGDPLHDAQTAVNAGYKAVFLTLGTSKERGADWEMIDRLRQGIGVPLILKGIMNIAEAKTAAGNGIAGIVVSSYSTHEAVRMAAPIEVLPEIADAVGGRLKILVDGGFRRGSDVLKALAMGADAALLGRPPVWALSAYGADGVARLLELLQTELARDMAMCGKRDLHSIDRSLVKMHRRTEA